MTIDITQAAAKEIDRIKNSRQKPETNLRLKVKSGGCSGLIYCLELESTEESQNDLQFSDRGIKIVIDPDSYNTIEGTTIDYSEDLMGGGFRFNNPNATQNCSCGISFKIES